MLTFDRARLRSDLEGLDRWQVVAFAGTCAEVLIPGYRRFAELEEVGDVDLLNAVLDAAWAALPEDASAELPVPSPDTILGLLPQEEDWNEWAPQAENAVAAVHFVAKLQDSGDVDLAVREAQQAYEAVEELVARQAPDGGLLDAAARTRLLESDPVQAELERQEQVVRTLRESPDDRRALLAELRRSARQQAVGGG